MGRQGSSKQAVSGSAAPGQGPLNGRDYWSVRGLRVRPSGLVDRVVKWMRGG